MGWWVHCGGGMIGVVGPVGWRDPKATSLLHPRLMEKKKRDRQMVTKRS